MNFNRHHIFRIVHLVIWTVLMSALIIAQQPSGLDIIKQANLVSYYAGEDGSAQILMKVFAKGKDEPLKKMFYMLKKDLQEGGEQLFFIYFTKPSDIKNTTFLVHKKINEDDIRRLYIPASDKVLAIAGSRKQDPFMGSDFSYEDISGRHFTVDNHQLLGEEIFNEDSVYVVESIPKVKESKIAKIKSWILKSGYTPVKVEFYNHQGQIFKSYSGEKSKTFQGIPTILKRTMTSPLEGTKTVILLNPKKVNYNLGFSDDIFSERSLKNPPYQYLK